MVALIVIAVLLVGTTSFISALGYTSYVRNAIGIVLTPIQSGANYVIDGIETLFSSKDDYKALQKENEKLKVQLADQAEKIAQAELILEENEKLKDYLGIKEDHTDFILAEANVTGRQSGSHSTVLTLDKGTSHGIEPGMPIIDKYGLVGCISEVGLTWSKATTLTEPDISVGVYVERSGESGITNGTFKASKEGLFTVTYLSPDSDVQVGDRIITSGDGSVYPDGIFAGTVEYLEKDPITRDIVAYIKPSSNISEIHEVMIITRFVNKYE